MINKKINSFLPNLKTTSLEVVFFSHSLIWYFCNYINIDVK